MFKIKMNKKIMMFQTMCWEMYFKKEIQQMNRIRLIAKKALGKWENSSFEINKKKR